MRKLFLFLIALASIAFGVCSLASAQYGGCLGACGTVASGGGGSITWTPGISTPWQNITFGANGTFHPNNFVAPPANSNYCVFVGIQRGTGGIGTFTVTIDGSTPTTVVGDTGGAGVASGIIILYCITKASFASDTVVISGSSNLGWETAIGGYFQNFSSSTATATGCQQGQFSNPITITTVCTGSTPTTITVPTSGIGITAMYSPTGTAGTSAATFAWSTTSTSNITSAAGDASAFNVTNPVQLDVGHTATAGSWGPSLTLTPSCSFNCSIVAATFN